MPKEKRKVEEFDESDSSYEGNGWIFGIEWFLVLVLLAVVILGILWVLGPIFANSFPDVLSSSTPH